MAHFLCKILGHRWNYQGKTGPHSNGFLGLQAGMPAGGSGLHVLRTYICDRCGDRKEEKGAWD